MHTYISQHIQNSISAKQEILNSKTHTEALIEAANTIITAFEAGNKVLIAGNGGSAADAQHIAAEWVARYKLERKGLPAIALSTDTSALTAIGNDYGFEHLFSRQVNALGQENDVFIGISTSGNSGNVIAAVEEARAKSMHVIAFTGAAGKLPNLADITLSVPSTNTPTIQESHIMYGHLLCGLVEESMFGSLA